MSAQVHLLLVEDEDPKREHIVSFLNGMEMQFDIEIARSVHSAIECVRKKAPDLMLLDMSLPTYDVGANEPGGRPQGFGGIEIMRYVDRFGINVPIIVITAYEAFTKDGKDIDLRSLREELRSEHPNTFRGLIYFDAEFEEWGRDLTALMKTSISD